MSDKEFFNFCADDSLMEAVELYKEGGINLEFKDNGGRTPLAIAAGRGHIEIVQWLIKVGASIEAQDNDGRTVLMRAAIGRHIPVMEFLLAKGADIDAVNKYGIPVLADSFSHQTIDKIPNYGISGLGTSEFIPYFKEKEEVAKFLIEKGADIQKLCKKGLSALRYAVQFRLLGTVQLLIQKGADISAKGTSGETALEYAEKNKLYFFSKVLKEEQAQSPEYDAEKAAHDTAQFFKFCSENFFSDAQKLYEAGNIDIHFTDSRGNTALIAAAGKGLVKMVQWLLEIGSPIEAKEINERAALAQAAIGGHIPVMEVLLAAGSDINAMNKEKRSVLIDAIYSAPQNLKEQTALWIVGKGAKVLPKDTYKKTALQYAEDKKLANLVTAIKESEKIQKEQLLQD